jgi:hypothetical protein
MKPPQNIFLTALILVGLVTIFTTCTGQAEGNSVPDISSIPTQQLTFSPTSTATLTEPTVPLFTTTPTETAAPPPTHFPSPIPTPAFDWQFLGTNGPSARSGMSIAYDSYHGRVILFGGTCSGFACADTWQYMPTNGWRLVDTVGPAAREAAYMTYNSINQKVVLFGGHEWAGNHLDDTWEFDGRQWLQVKTATVPPGRSNQGIVFDENRQKVIMFGGWKESQLDQDILGDTWEYDGTDWTLINTPIAPAPRSNMKLVYAPNLGGVLLFGGIGRDSVHYNDTWLYNEQGWRQLQPPQSPPARYGYQMAYDSDNKVVVLFGGTSFNTASIFSTYSDTWIFDGEQWLELNPSQNPPPTWNAGFVYLPGLQGVFMFGGNSPNQNDLSQDIWLFELIQ